MERWSEPPTVGTDHLLGFGGVIHHYAMVETGLKAALACLLAIDVVDILIFAEPYSSASLGQVVRSLASARVPVSAASVRVISFADGLHAEAGLRNAIAHDRWIVGSRYGAIRPTRIDIRSGKARVKGSDADDQDWLPADLYSAADRLADIAKGISDFLVENACIETTIK